MITPDSAWRQWRGALRDFRAAEEKLKQARAIWLQTLFEGFEQRRRDADAAGLEVGTKEALIALGIPCIDCLAPAGKAHRIVNSRDEQATYKTYATCGGVSVDPTVIGMPELFREPTS